MSEIIISQGALRRNLQKLRDKTDARIMAVLKCNGYGMGIVEYAGMLAEAGVDAFAVSRPDEAFKLRESGFEPYLLLLSPVWDAEVIRRLADSNVRLTISGAEHAAIVSNAIGERSAGAHLAIDTGMHRYGFSPDEIKAFSADNLNFTIDGVFTHFYASVNADLTAGQHDIFMDCVATLRKNGIVPGLVHCCASNAFLSFKDYHHDMVRLGSALVGTTDGLERIWRFETEVAAVRDLAKGNALGYGGWKTKKALKAATVPVGFSDGVMLERYEPVGFYGALRRFGKDVLRPSCPIRVIYKGSSLPILGGAGTTHLSVDITGTDAVEGSTLTIESNPMFLSPDIRRVYVEEL